MSKNKNLEEIDLRSEEVQEVLSRVPNWLIRRGSILFLFLIFQLFLMAYFIHYPDTIEAQAYVTTKVPPEKVYAKVTAKIDSFYVESDAKIEKGQRIALLESTADYNDIQELNKAMEKVTISRDSFYFPIEHLPMLFLGEIEYEFAEFENAYMAYRLHDHLKPFQNEIRTQKLNLSELRNRLQTLRSQKQINERELQYQKLNLERNKKLLEKGVIARQEYEDIEIAFLKSNRAYENLVGGESQIREAINLSNNASVKSGIDRTREELQLLKKTIQTYNKLKNSIETWEQQFVLKAQISGNIVFLEVRNKHQTVKQGDLVFTVIPNNQKIYIAKLKAPARNAGKIAIGQDVKIMLENYPEGEYGVLEGTVSEISEIPDNEGLYHIDVSIPSQLRTSYNKNIRFHQEMAGRATIIMDHLTLLERIFYQFRELLGSNTA